MLRGFICREKKGIFPGIEFAFDATNTRRNIIRSAAAGTLGAELQFSIKPDSSATPQIRMVIDNAGNVA